MRKYHLSGVVLRGTLHYLPATLAWMSNSHFEPIPLPLNSPYPHLIRCGNQKEITFATYKVKQLSQGRCSIYSDHYYFCFLNSMIFTYITVILTWQFLSLHTKGKSQYLRNWEIRKYDSALKSFLQ